MSHGVFAFYGKKPLGQGAAVTQASFRAVEKNASMPAGEPATARAASRAGFSGDGTLAGASSLAANAATYVFYAAATRALGVENGGALLAVLAASLMCSVPVGVVGLGLSGIVSHLRAMHDTGAVANLLRRTSVLFALASLALVLLASISSPLIDDFFHVDVPLAALGAALTIVSFAGLLLARGFMQGFGEFRSLAFSNLTECATKLAAAFAVFAYHAAFGTVLAAFGAALLAAFVVSIWLVVRHGAHNAVVEERAGLMRDAIPLFTAMGAITVMTFFDAVATRHYLSPREAGLYNVAALAGRALMTVLAFVPSVLLPKVRERAAVNDDTRAVLLPAAAFTGIVCTASLIVFVFAPHLIAVFLGGRAYADAAGLIPLYGVAASALAAASVIATYHAGRGRALVGRSLLVVMAFEIAGIVLLHDNAGTILRIIVTGHVSALCAVFVAGWIESRGVRLVTR